MQHNPNSPWRTPASDYAKPSLQHTVSMVNLHDEPNWYTRGPSSPTASSASSCTSRSATPTSANTKNPWSHVMNSPSSTYSDQSNSTYSTQSTNSPKHSPDRTPQHTSRATTPTPIAPQPLRPINAVAGFVPMSPPPTSSGEAFRTGDYPSSPISSFPGSPNPYRQPSVPFSPLVNGFINTPLLSAQGQSLSGWFYELASKQFTDRAMVRKVWQWTISNPKLAILLVVCDDAASWRQAAFFDLRDESLPFPEDRLQGIVSDPQRVVDEQWRATAKELPLTGTHVDFGSRETVPLQHINLVRTSRGSEKSVDRVRMLGNADDQIYIRKRFVITRSSQKASLLEQINKFKAYDHKNIAKLLCSYAQPSHVGILTTRTQHTLDDYLGVQASDQSRAKLIVDWMYDLAHALDYLHSQSICHRSIRPRKILIEGSRVFLAPFGIGTSNDSHSPTVPGPQRLDQIHTYFQDQTYIYAAPETLLSRGKRYSDVFSLGCVFLSMITVAQGHSLSRFAQYREGSSQDASFHNNLDRVASWRNRLQAMTNSGQRNGMLGSGRKVRQLKSEAEWLEIIEQMIKPKYQERVKIAKVVHNYGTGKTIGVRRRSLDGGGYSGQVGAALGLANSNTASGVASGSNGFGHASGAGQKPELSVFDGYFQQQQPRRFEPAGIW
ncbi:kinase-like protein [Karstenula rhodostoma CBS 690.94]|uniref:Kinase-like protein n=1 Tax=Karstenula rhodostoma CBS 690.94 TaxID=1392251 RepID=A0A9P4PXI3_9PLEO|nr:kinase-like protein [Karstenula rhodostoma CBS 690.94]